MAGTIRAIEISFPELVELTQQDQQELVALISRITDRYDAQNPGRVMWCFGIGMKMLSNPYTMSDNEPLQFDDHVFQIECNERADYKYPCAICGKPQGDHKGHIIDPPAGDCPFAVAKLN